jgi:hypothetical protein
MAHSQALRAAWVLIGIELLLYALAAATGYLSATSHWRWFAGVSVFGLVLLTVSCVSKARPRLAELAFLDDTAAQMARSALDYGVGNAHLRQLIVELMLRDVAKGRVSQIVREARAFHDVGIRPGSRGLFGLIRDEPFRDASAELRDL